MTLRFDPAYVARTRKPLDARLDMKGQELFARDKASALQFAKLLDTRVGLTQLRESQFFENSLSKKKERGDQTCVRSHVPTWPAKSTGP